MVVLAGHHHQASGVELVAPLPRLAVVVLAGHQHQASGVELADLLHESIRRVGAV